MLYTKQSGTDAVKTFIFSDGQIVYEQTGTDNVGATVYTYGLTRISAKFRTGLTDEQSIRYYYLYNAHGDVVRIISGTNITVKTYDYDAFGNDRNALETDTNPFRYCGEYFDTATETYFLRARWYDPATGRFTQQDSWAYYKPDDPLSLNLYLYCYGNPLRYFDCFGNNAIDSIVHFSNNIIDTIDVIHKNIRNNTKAEVGLGWGLKCGLQSIDLGEAYELLLGIELDGSFYMGHRISQSVSLYSKEYLLITSGVGKADVDPEMYFSPLFEGIKNNSTTSVTKKINVGLADISYDENFEVSGISISLASADVFMIFGISGGLSFELYDYYKDTINDIRNIWSKNYEKEN